MELSKSKGTRMNPEKHGEQLWKMKKVMLEKTQDWPPPELIQMWNACLCITSHTKRRSERIHYYSVVQTD